MFELAESMRVAGRSDMLVAILRGLQQDKNIDVRAEAHFRLGQWFVTQKNYEAAEIEFRALLAEKPDAGAVRLALAEVMMKLGAARQAGAELRAAQRYGLPADVLRAVNRTELALRSARRLGGSIELDGVADSNINRATSLNTIDLGGLPFNLTSDARSQRGLGLAISGQAYWRPQLTSNLNLVAIAGEAANLYNQNQFNDVQANARLGLEWTRKTSRIRLAGSASRRWFGGNLFSRDVGLDVSGFFRSGKAGLVTVEIGGSHVTYPSLRTQGGWLASASTSYERTFTPRLSARVSVRADHADAEAAAFRTWTYGGTLLLSRQFGSVLGYATSSLFRIEGAGAFSFPPERRSDRLWQTEIGLRFAEIRHQFVPFLRLKHVANSSPVFFYGFTQTRFEAGLSHDF
jgi:tetratricopeptide (TPR) repeat protein